MKKVQVARSRPIVTEVSRAVN